MPDIRRADVQPNTTADRDGRTEALLLQGLDEYFNGSYEEAVHLWTRVLFLDRTHARARAYIARARTAIGERERRADELLHQASECIERGEVDQAKRLLTEAGQSAGADQRVAEVWARYDRVMRTRPDRPGRITIVDAVPMRTWRGRAAAAAAFMAMTAAVVLVVTAAASPAVREWLTGESLTAVTPAGALADLPVLSSAEAALVRARTLYANGRLAEALAVLDEADATVRARESTDALRAEIQRWLLSPRRPPAPGEPSSEGGKP